MSLKGSEVPEDLNAVKLVKEDEGMIEGYGIPFGGPQHGRDLDGEAFTSDTKFNLDAYPDRRPLFYSMAWTSPWDLTTWAMRSRRCARTRASGSRLR